MRKKSTNLKSPTPSEVITIEDSILPDHSGELNSTSDSAKYREATPGLQVTPSFVYAIAALSSGSFKQPEGSPRSSSITRPESDNNNGQASRFLQSKMPKSPRPKRCVSQEQSNNLARPSLATNSALFFSLNEVITIEDSILPDHSGQSNSTSDRAINSEASPELQLETPSLASPIAARIASSTAALPSGSFKQPGENPRSASSTTRLESDNRNGPASGFVQSRMPQTSRPKHSDSPEQRSNLVGPRVANNSDLSVRTDYMPALSSDPEKRTQTIGSKRLLTASDTCTQPATNTCEMASSLGSRNCQTMLKMAKHTETLMDQLHEAKAKATHNHNVSDLSCQRQQSLPTYTGQKLLLSHRTTTLASDLPQESSCISQQDSTDKALWTKASATHSNQEKMPASSDDCQEQPSFSTSTACLIPPDKASVSSFITNITSTTTSKQPVSLVPRRDESKRPNISNLPKNYHLPESFQAELLVGKLQNYSLLEPKSRKQQKQLKHQQQTMTFVSKSNQLLSKHAAELPGEYQQKNIVSEPASKQNKRQLEQQQQQQQHCPQQRQQHQQQYTNQHQRQQQDQPNLSGKRNKKRPSTVNKKQNVSLTEPQNKKLRRSSHTGVISSRTVHKEITGSGPNNQKVNKVTPTSKGVSPGRNQDLLSRTELQNKDVKTATSKNSSIVSPESSKSTSNQEEFPMISHFPSISTLDTTSSHLEHKQCQVSPKIRQPTFGVIDTITKPRSLSTKLETFIQQTSGQLCSIPQSVKFHASSLAAEDLKDIPLRPAAMQQTSLIRNIQHQTHVSFQKSQSLSIDNMLEEPCSERPRKKLRTKYHGTSSSSYDKHQQLPSSSTNGCQKDREKASVSRSSLTRHSPDHSSQTHLHIQQQTPALPSVSTSVTECSSDVQSGFFQSPSTSTINERLPKPTSFPADEKMPSIPANTKAKLFSSFSTRSTSPKEKSSALVSTFNQKSALLTKPTNIVTSKSMPAQSSLGQQHQTAPADVTIRKGHANKDRGQNQNDFDGKSIRTTVLLQSFCMLACGVVRTSRSQCAASMLRRGARNPCRRLQIQAFKNCCNESHAVIITKGHTCYYKSLRKKQQQLNSNVHQSAEIEKVSNNNNSITTALQEPISESASLKMQSFNANKHESLNGVKKQNQNNISRSDSNRTSVDEIEQSATHAISQTRKNNQSDFESRLSESTSEDYVGQSQSRQAVGKKSDQVFVASNDSLQLSQKGHIETGSVPKTIACISDSSAIFSTTLLGDSQSNSINPQNNSATTNNQRDLAADGIAVELDADQREVLKHWNEQFLIINAGPGSGKTLVLCQLIRQIFQQLMGRARVLVLAFNRFAVAELKRRLSDVVYNVPLLSDEDRDRVLESTQNGCLVSTFDSFAYRCSEKSCPKDYEKEFEKNVSLLGTLLPSSPARTWDWVVVDEAQDVNKARKEMISILRETCKHLVVAGDPRQSLNNDTWFADLWCEEKGQTFKQSLQYNHRSSPNIIKFLNLYSKINFSACGLHKDQQVPGGQDDKKDLKLNEIIENHHAKSHGHVIAHRLMASACPMKTYAIAPVTVKKCGVGPTTDAIVNEIKNKNGRTQIIKSLEMSHSAGNQKYQQQDAYQIGTVASLKGTERDTVVVYGACKSYGNVIKRDSLSRKLYVALSRARKNLHVITDQTLPANSPLGLMEESHCTNGLYVWKTNLTVKELAVERFEIWPTTLSFATYGGKDFETQERQSGLLSDGDDMFLGEYMERVLAYCLGFRNVNPEPPLEDGDVKKQYETDVLKNPCFAVMHALRSRQDKILYYPRDQILSGWANHQLHCQPFANFILGHFGSSCKYQEALEMRIKAHRSNKQVGVLIGKADFAFDSGIVEVKHVAKLRKEDVRQACIYSTMLAKSKHKDIVETFLLNLRDGELKRGISMPQKQLKLLARAKLALTNTPRHGLGTKAHSKVCYISVACIKNDQKQVVEIGAVAFSLAKEIYGTYHRIMCGVVKLKPESKVTNEGTQLASSGGSEPSCPNSLAHSGLLVNNPQILEQEIQTRLFRDNFHMWVKGLRKTPTIVYWDKDVRADLELDKITDGSFKDLQEELSPSDSNTLFGTASLEKCIEEKFSTNWIYEPYRAFEDAVAVAALSVDYFQLKEKKLKCDAT